MTKITLNKKFNRARKILKDNIKVSCGVFGTSIFEDAVEPLNCNCCPDQDICEAYMTLKLLDDAQKEIRVMPSKKHQLTN